MYNPFRHLSSLYLIAICSIAFGLSGCENPGSVGADITDPGSEVVIDTLIINGLQAENPNSYSGELSYFSAGQYDDPLFGNMAATGYLKPNLPASGDTMTTDAKMLLRIMYNLDQVYGDDEAAQGFDLYKIDEVWRDRALMINDQLATSQKIGEFTVGKEDSLTINLTDIAPQWVDEYRAYAEADTADSSNVDSTYRYETHGLALVPNNTGKIIPLYSDSTSFVIQNPEADTFDVGLNQWAYTLERGNNSSVPQGSLPLNSTYEDIIRFGDLGVADLDISLSGLSRAELILSENTQTLEQGLPLPPATEKRAKETTAYLHFADPGEIPENIDPGVPLDNVLRVGGTYSEDDNTYRFDITNLVNRIIRSGFPEDREFFVTLPNNGIIKPSLIYTNSDQVPDEYKPKVVITSLKNPNN